MNYLAFFCLFWGWVGGGMRFCAILLVVLCNDGARHFCVPSGYGFCY